MKRIAIIILILIGALLAIPFLGNAQSGATIYGAISNRSSKFAKDTTNYYKNGINKNADTIKLGGALTESTTISGSNSLTFTNSDIWLSPSGQTRCTTPFQCLSTSTASFRGQFYFWNQTLGTEGAYSYYYDRGIEVTPGNWNINWIKIQAPDTLLNGNMVLRWPRDTGQIGQSLGRVSGKNGVVQLGWATNGDNLGNHTMIQDLLTNGFTIRRGSVDTTGMYFDLNNNIGIGANKYTSAQPKTGLGIIDKCLSFSPFTGDYGLSTDYEANGNLAANSLGNIYFMGNSSMKNNISWYSGASNTYPVFAISRSNQPPGEIGFLGAGDGASALKKAIRFFTNGYTASGSGADGGRYVNTIYDDSCSTSLDTAYISQIELNSNAASQSIAVTGFAKKGYDNFCTIIGRYTGPGSNNGAIEFATSGAKHFELDSIGRALFHDSGLANKSALVLDGNIYTGGTTTTTKPLLLIEALGETSTNWSTNGTALGINIPSASNASYVDFKRSGGASAFKVLYDGRVIANGAMIIGGTSVDASAQLQLSSTTKGFLPPKLTTTQRDAISSPSEGLMIMNTTTHKLNFFNGTSWEQVTSL